MRIRGIKHIIFPAFFLVIAVFSDTRSQAKPVISSSANSWQAKASRQLPHAELELVKQKESLAFHCAVQKKIYLQVTIKSFTANQNQVVSENLFIKKSLLLTSTYLLHIYPFHHFW